MTSRDVSPHARPAHARPTTLLSLRRSLPRTNPAAPTTLPSPNQCGVVPTTLAEPLPAAPNPTGRHSFRQVMACQASATMLTRPHLPAACDWPSRNHPRHADLPVPVMSNLLGPSRRALPRAAVSRLVDPSAQVTPRHAWPYDRAALLWSYAMPSRLSIDLPRRSPSCPLRADLSSPAIPCPAQAFRLVPSGRTSPSPSDPAHQHAPGRSTATSVPDRYRPNPWRQAVSGLPWSPQPQSRRLLVPRRAFPTPVDKPRHAHPTLGLPTRGAMPTRSWPTGHRCSGHTWPTRRDVSSRATRMPSRLPHPRRVPSVPSVSSRHATPSHEEPRCNRPSDQPSPSHRRHAMATSRGSTARVSVWRRPKSRPHQPAQVD